MTIESATYINGLNASYPGASDVRTEGDDHLRLIKSTVKATFPNVSGAVTPTDTVINNLAAGTFPSVSVTGVVGLTTAGGVVSIGRGPSEPGQHLDIDTTTLGGHLVTAYSRYNNPKGVVFNVTTDGSDTAPTGALNYTMKMLSVTTMTIDSSGLWTFVGCPIFGLPSSPNMLSTNSTMTISLSSNTNLRISVKGTDGTVRVANLTLA